jgi:SAM-dependent methyltransferase
MGRFWDARARENAEYFVDNRLDYRHGDEERFWAQGERDLDLMLESVGARVGPDETVLDIGCGVGRLTRVLAARAARVQGIDVSAEMLERARGNLAACGNVTLHLGDGRSLAPIADESVDGVVSLVVFQHIPDPAITLGYVREIGRVLRAGGWAAFQVSNDPDIHARDYPKAPLKDRLLRRAPRGQDDPAWRGSAVGLDALRTAAADGGLTIAEMRGEGTQYCIVRAVKA